MMCVIPFVTVSYKTQRAKRKDGRGVLRSSSKLKKQLIKLIFQDIMNIILFCRIVYTDMQVFKCSKIQNTISTTDNGNKSRDNVRHLKTEFNNLNQSSATISNLNQFKLNS